MRARYLFIVLFVISALFMQRHVAAAERTQEITVSAAISLKNVFEEMGKLYESRNYVKVVFNFGASADLMRQIEGGAPVDVFASAAQKDMDEAEKKSLILTGSRANFTANTVVLVVPATTNTSLKSFENLKSGSVKKIAIGNPKTVPAGRYAEEIFRHYRILDSIKGKCILTENVRQALDYVTRGEVDAGVVYSTDAMTRPKELRIAATAQTESHRPVIYPIAAVKGAKKEPDAKAFISFVLSHEGQRILEKHGFKKP